ncbi:MAG: tetratricopeptide repeat protein, partial [Planctomycetota bacterium]
MAWIGVGEVRRGLDVLLRLAEQIPHDERPLRWLARSIPREVDPDPSFEQRFRGLLARRPDDLRLTTAFARWLLASKQTATLVGWLDGRLSKLETASPADEGSSTKTPSPTALEGDARSTLRLLLARAVVTGHPARAQTLVMQSLRERETAEAHVVKAEVERALGLNPAALRSVRRALELSADLPSARRLLARLLLDGGDPVAADRTLRPLVKGRTPTLADLELSAEIQTRLGRHREAVSIYRRVLREGGRKDRLWLRMALLTWTYLDDPVTAETMLKKSVEENPRFADPHYHLGLIHRSSGRLPAAREAWTAYVRLAPSGPFASRARRAIDGLRPKASPTAVVSRRSRRAREPIRAPDSAYVDLEKGILRNEDPDEE